MLILGHVGMGTGELKPFDQVFRKSKYIDPRVLNAFDGVDALIIWGGEDIHPSLYNEPVSQYTWVQGKPSYRDNIENQTAQRAIEKGIPIIGICRGAQLLCALAGGKLIQHVDGHGHDHLIDTYDEQTMLASSVHHQMMYPFDIRHTLLAWSTHRQSDRYIMGDNKTNQKMFKHVEPEIVWFPEIKGLAIQGHPEFMGPDDEFVQYCMKLTHKFILNQE